MKSFKKALGIILSVVLIMQLGVIAFAGSDYTIVNPYEDVIWSGENAWGAYKGSLHTHTTYSDADDTLPVMVKEAYNQDYDFLAVSDHGITGVDWNKTPEIQPLYLYQYIIDNPYEHLTDEEYEQIKNGTYPLYNGTARNKKMVPVLGANEFNNLSLTKNHVNGYFLEGTTGSGFLGMENEYGYEQAIKFIDENGGLSHINHPGDWLASNSNPDIVNDPESIKFFGDLILKYDSCLGIETLNERNGTTGYDRILWDNLLMYCLPYGKNVIGYSNSDAHHTGTVDTSYMYFMMKESGIPCRQVHSSALQRSSVRTIKSVLLQKSTLQMKASPIPCLQALMLTVIRLPLQQRTAAPFSGLQTARLSSSRKSELSP